MVVRTTMSPDPVTPAGARPSRPEAPARRPGRRWRARPSRPARGPGTRRGWPRRARATRGGDPERHGVGPVAVLPGQLAAAEAELAAQPQRVRYISQRRAGDAALRGRPRTDANDGGCGSQVVAGRAEPERRRARSHGSGTRQPSRPRSVRPERTRSGPGARRRAASCAPAGRAPRPGRGTRTPGSASISSVAARARRRPSAASGCGSVGADAVRRVSSSAAARADVGVPDHVVVGQHPGRRGADRRRWPPCDASITARTSSARHGAAR